MLLAAGEVVREAAQSALARDLAQRSLVLEPLPVALLPGLFGPGLGPVLSRPYGRSLEPLYFTTRCARLMMPYEPCRLGVRRC
jgi:hypothetical protein